MFKVGCLPLHHGLGPLQGKLFSNFCLLNFREGLQHHLQGPHCFDHPQSLGGNLTLIDSYNDALVVSFQYFDLTSFLTIAFFTRKTKLLVIRTLNQHGPSWLHLITTYFFFTIIVVVTLLWKTKKRFRMCESSRVWTYMATKLIK